MLLVGYPEVKIDVGSLKAEFSISFSTKVFLFNFSFKTGMFCFVKICIAIQSVYFDLSTLQPTQYEKVYPIPWHQGINTLILCVIWLVIFELCPPYARAHNCQNN